LEKFQALENKSEFIHNALNPTISITPDGKAEMLHTSYEVTKDSPKKPKVGTCKQHGIDRNLCRMMKHA
jgi:hypothetical protein